MKSGIPALLSTFPTHGTEGGGQPGIQNAKGVHNLSKLSALTAHSEGFPRTKGKVVLGAGVLGCCARC